LDEDGNVAGVIHQLHHRPASTQSDFARKHAWHIALAASHGLIVVGDDRRWRPTSYGLLFVNR